jgi:hypothetical protein
LNIFNLININNKIDLFYIAYVYYTPSILIVLDLVVFGTSFVCSSVVKVNYFQILTFFDLKLVKNIIKIQLLLNIFIALL